MTELPEPNKAKDEDAQGNTSASGTGPTQAVPYEPDTEGTGDPNDTTAVVSDTSDDDANPKNDPSDDKVAKEIASWDEKSNNVGDGDDNDETPVVKDNGVDLFAASDTGSNRQGNAYGISKDSVENFKADLEAERDRLNTRLEALEDELNALDVPSDNENINIAEQKKAEAQGKDRSEI